MKITCHWCDRTRVVLPSQILVCITCDMNPDTVIPNMPKPKR